MRLALLRAAALLTVAGAWYLSQAEESTGTLRVEIFDPATGRPTPAMVSLVSVADGTWRTPPDGRQPASFTRVPDFYDPPPWTPGAPGPVRLMNGEWNNNQTRSSIYSGAASLPWWRQPADYFVSGPFTITLPAGRWRLAVRRGLETLPAITEFDLAPGASLTRRVGLHRWANLAASGWYSGDDHVHYPRQKPVHDQLLAAWAAAEDLHVVNTVQQRLLQGFDPPTDHVTFPQNFGDATLDGRLIVSGQEDPSLEIEEQGHTLALHLPEAVGDPRRFHLYDLMFDAAHARGGVTGYAHLAWAPAWYRARQPERNPTWDATLNVIAGRVDFFEILQFGRLGLDDYYDFLNLGFRLAASAGSDMPWGGALGESRVYVRAPRLTAADWFDGLAHGRTFVSNGPIPSLTVNGRGPGETIETTPDGQLTIDVRLHSPAALGAPVTLDLIDRGTVLFTVPANGSDVLQANWKIPARTSRWLAVRGRTASGAVTHTSPVYVTVPNTPLVDKTTRERLLLKRLKILQAIEARLADPRHTRQYAPGELAAHRERVETARRYYGQGR